MIAKLLALNPKILLGAGALLLVAALGAGAYIALLELRLARSELAVSEAERQADHWQRQAAAYAASQKATLEALERQKAEAARNQQILADVAYQARRAAERAASIRTEIVNAPQSDTAPAAPVLDHTLDRMLDGQVGAGPAAAGGGAGRADGAAEIAP